MLGANEAGILHRDVKPHNVLVTSYGEPALADFGIASVQLGDQATGATACTTGAYTVVHAAPEILEGKAGTSAADIYSLGSTLYTLLAGQAPFAREASTGLAPLVTRILRNDVPVIPRPGVPPELEELLRRSMAARPRDRPASAAELGTSLADLGRRLTCQETAGPASPPSRHASTPPISARRLLVVLGGALGVLLAVFMAWGLTQNETSAGPAGAAQAADRYTPAGLVVTRGPDKGELIVTWRMPIRPDVVATVIYEGSGTARARAIFSYSRSPVGDPRATLHGLPARQRVCLSAAHVVSVNDQVSNAISAPVCAVPR